METLNPGQVRENGLRDHIEPARPEEGNVKAHDGEDYKYELSEGPIEDGLQESGREIDDWKYDLLKNNKDLKKETKRKSDKEASMPRFTSNVNHHWGGTDQIVKHQQLNVEVEEKKILVITVANTIIQSRT